MANVRKPDVNQYPLCPGGDPKLHASRLERKWFIRAVFEHPERIRQERPEMSPTDCHNSKELLCYMAGCEGPEGICPYQENMAKAIGKSKRTVRTLLAHLIALQIVTIIKRTGRRNFYAIDYERMATIGRDDVKRAHDAVAAESGNDRHSERQQLPGRPAGVSAQSGDNCRAPLEELPRTEPSNNRETTESATDVASGELPPTATSPATTPDNVPTEFIFPTTGKGAREWTLTQNKLAEYIESFPGLDVPNELRKARQWCRDNPKKRKTASGMLTYLTRWLSRSQNRGQHERSTAGKRMYDKQRFG